MNAPQTPSANVSSAINATDLGTHYLQQEPGSLTLLDVRTPVEFREKHVKGSTLLPLDSLDTAAFKDLAANSSGPVYLLCRSGKRAVTCQEKMRQAGLENGVVVEGGILAWEQAKLPLVYGKEAISLERQVRIAAGALVLFGAFLGWFAHPAWLALPASVGGGLVFAGITDHCGMGLLLARMPWNQVNAKG